MEKPQPLQLNYYKSYEDDVYKDRVRIHEGDRGSNIKAGQIYLLRTSPGTRPRLVEVRGNADGESRPREGGPPKRPYILIDEVVRNDLGLAEIKPGQTLDVWLEKATPEQERDWQRIHSDPQIRLTARVADRADKLAEKSIDLGNLSMVLGFVSVVLAILSFHSEFGKAYSWIKSHLAPVPTQNDAVARPGSNPHHADSSMLPEGGGSARVRQSSVWPPLPRRP